MSGCSGKTVLVTGASGFLGRHVIQSLEASGFQCISFRRHPSYPDDFSELDVSNYAAIVHLAHAMPNGTDARGSFDSNQRACELLGAACTRQGNFPLIIFASSLSIHCNPQTSYGRSKSECEAALALSGAHVAILRLGLVYKQGEKLGLAARLVRLCRMSRTLPLIGMGNQSVHPVALDTFLEKVVQLIRDEVEINSNPMPNQPHPAPLFKICEVREDGMPFRDFLSWRLRQEGAYVVLPLLLPFFVWKSMITMVERMLGRSPFSLDSLHGLVWQRWRVDGPNDTRTINFDEWRAEAPEATEAFMQISRAILGFVPCISARDAYFAACCHSNIPILPTKFERFLLSNRALMGASDLLSALLFRSGQWRQRLLLAAAILECTPRAASTLHPTRRQPEILIHALAWALLSIFFIPFAICILAFTSRVREKANRLAPKTST